MPKIKINIDVISDTDTGKAQIISEAYELVDPSTRRPHVKLYSNETNIELTCGKGFDLLDAVKQEILNVEMELAKFGSKYWR